MLATFWIINQQHIIQACDLLHTWHRCILRCYCHCTGAQSVRMHQDCHRLCGSRECGSMPETDRGAKAAQHRGLQQGWASRVPCECHACRQAAGGAHGGPFSRCSSAPAGHFMSRGRCTDWKMYVGNVAEPMFSLRFLWIGFSCDMTAELERRCGC